MAATAAARVQDVYYERSGAALLSLTPPETSKKPPVDPVWPILYTHLQARLNYMRTWRYSWWAYWAQIARLILPYRYHWVITPNSMNRGNPVNDAIINGHATLAMRICAAGLQTGLMSSSRPWFRLGLARIAGEPDPDARQWLDLVSDMIYDALGSSNFYEEAPQLCQDLATFGTSPMIIYEDAETLIRCYVPCAGEYFLAVGGRLTVDTLYREYTYTVIQIVDFFGLDNCPDEIRVKWMEGGGALEFEYVIAHAIEPNFALSDTKTGKQGGISPVPGGFVYREIYWLRDKQDCAPLSLRGFVERPFIAMRWSRTSNDPYGRGPGMDAFGDTAQLQHEEARKGEYIDKFVRPPMVGDSRLANQPSSIRSGDITFVNGADGKQMFYPAFEVNPAGFAPLTADIEGVEKRIDRFYFVDTFLAISQMEGVQPRETLELQLRQGEKIQMLGPVIEGAERELSHVVYRVAAIMKRRGMFPPMPDSMKGKKINIEYVSMMKLMQQAAETAGIEGTMKFAASMSEASQLSGSPPPLRIIKGDDTLRRYADRVGFPAALIMSPEEVAVADKSKAAAAAAQHAAALTLPATQAAKNLSDTDVGGGVSALQGILGTGGGGAPAPPR